MQDRPRRFRSVGGALVVLAAVALAPSTADAGKKKKGAEPVEEPAAVEEAAPTVATAPAMVDVPCHFPVGSVHRYQVESEVTQSKLATGTSKRRTRSTTAVHVVGHELPHTVVDLKAESFEVLEVDNPVLVKIMESVAEMDVLPRIQVDHEELTLSVVNLEEMTEVYARVADLTMEALAAGESVPPEAASGIKAMLTRPEMVQANTTNNWAPLFQYGCGKLPLGETAYESALPNPLGGAPLPAIGILTVTDGPEVVVSIVEKVDMGRASEMLAPVLAQFGEQLPEEGARGVDELVGAIELTTTLEVKLDPGSGWPATWVATKQVQIGPFGGSAEKTVARRLPESP